MADLTVSADIDAFMASANDAAARTELGLTALATTTPGTGVATALGVNIGSAGAPVLFNGAGGTPTSLVGTNITGTAAGLTAGTASAVAVGGITGLGTGVGTALAIAVGSAGAPVLFNGAGGTPSSIVLTNATGTAASLTAGTASAVAVGGITGLGTGVATGLAINVGSAGAPVLFNGSGGTPSSLTLTNATGLPVAGGGTGRATSTTAYGLIAAGTTATGAHQTLAAGATTEILVGGGASALPVWTTAQGSGAPVRATSPTLTTPLLGTPTSGNLSNCTADGTNAVGYRNVPQNAKTGSYTLLATDVGKVVPNTTGGWTVNNSVHAAGDVISVYNDSASSQNITAGTITTMRLAGSASTGTRALAARGLATLYFQTASEVVVSGAGVT